MSGTHPAEDEVLAHAVARGWLTRAQAGAVAAEVARQRAARQGISLLAVLRAADLRPEHAAELAPMLARLDVGPAGGGGPPHPATAHDTTDSRAQAVAACREVLSLDATFDPMAELALERLDELGRGGMGVVWRVRDRRLEREAALKLMLPGGDPRQHEQAVRRFVREVRITARLDHPSIPPVYGAGTTSRGERFMLMKLIQGQPLGTRLKQHDWARPVDEVEARWLREQLEVVVKVGEAVAYAHGRGVIHRDLKPANVMVGRFGEVLVMDWGLAKDLSQTEAVRAEEDLELARASAAAGQGPRGVEAQDARAAADPALTRKGAMLGTLGYMSPEQVDGASDPRSDVYALGAVLVAALTGRPPIDGESAIQLLSATVTGEVVLPRQRRPGLPRELDSIAARALAREPAARFPDAAAFVGEVRAYLSGDAVRCHRYGPVEHAARLVRRRPTLLVGALAALALVGAVGGLLAWMASRERAAERREQARLREESRRERERAAELGAALDGARQEQARADQAVARLLHERAVLALLERRDRDAALHAATALAAGARAGAGAHDQASFRAAWLAARQGCWQAPRELVRVARPGGMHLAVSADGARLALVAQEEALLADTSSGQRRPLEHPGPGEPAVLTFAPDGRLLVGSRRGVTIVGADGAPGRTLPTQGRRPSGLAVSPDGRLLAIGLGPRIVVVDLETDRTDVLQGPADVPRWDARSIAWGGDALLLSPVSKVCVWDLRTKQNLGELGDELTQVLEVSADGRTFAAGGLDGGLRVWSLAPGASLSTQLMPLATVRAAHAGPVRGVAISLDGRRIATRGQDARVRLWSRTGHLLATLSAGHPPVDLAFAADGRLLVPTGAGAVLAFDVHRVAGQAGHRGPIRALGFSPDGEVLASAGEDGDVLLWGGPDAQRGVIELASAPLALVVDEGGRVTAGLANGRVERAAVGTAPALVGAHPRGDAGALAGAGRGRVVSGGMDVRLWEVGSASPVPVWTAPHPDGVLGVAVHPLSGRVASACEDGAVRVMELETGSIVGVLEGHREAAVCVAFSPDGRRVLAGGADGTIRAWEVSGGEPVATVEAHGAAVASLDVRADLLASGALDGEVAVWRLDSLERVATLRRDTGGVYAVRFSPDGNWLVAGGKDGTPHWWPLAEVVGGVEPEGLLREVERGTGLTIRIGRGEVTPVALEGIAPVDSRR